MTRDLANKIWSCPSGRRLVARIHEELADGKNAVCVLPKPLLSANPIAALSESLYNAKLGGIKTYQQPPKRNHPK